MENGDYNIPIRYSRSIQYFSFHGSFGSLNILLAALNQALPKKYLWGGGVSKTDEIVFSKSKKNHQTFSTN